MEMSEPLTPGRIAAARAASIGMTNAALAAKAGVNISTVSQFLGGRVTTRPRTAAKIAVALGLQPDALDPRSVEPDSARASYQLILTLPDFTGREDLTPSQLDFIRASATMGALRAVAEITRPT